MGSAFQWTDSPAELADDLGRWGKGLVDRVVADSEALAPEIEAWMRSNASWEDRTGIARANLTVNVEQGGNGMVILSLEHGVDYGVFLEGMQAGRFAILGPALAYWGSHFIARISR